MIGFLTATRTPASNRIYGEKLHPWECWRVRVRVRGRSMDDRDSSLLAHFCSPSSKGTNSRAIFRASLQTGSPVMGYAARQTAYQVGIRGNPLILFPLEAHPALEPLRSLHDTPLRASLVVAKSPLSHSPTAPSVVSFTFTWAERGFVMETRHSRLSYTTLQFLYFLMHSTSFANIHTVAVVFLIHGIKYSSNVCMTVWLRGGGEKKKNLLSIIYIFTKKQK